MPDPLLLRLLFARHGESEANHLRIISNRGQPHGLTALGRDQAEILGASLLKKSVTSIYASPILRALETAQVVGECLGLPVQPSDALHEPDCGIFEGRSDVEAWAEHSRVRQDWFEFQRFDSRMEGGESYQDVIARFTSFKKYLEDQSGMILLVTHGLLLSIILAEYVVNLPIPYILAHVPGYTQTVLIDPRADDWYAREWCGEIVDDGYLRTGSSVS